MTIRVIRPILLQIQHLMTGMAISVVEFQARGYKIRLIRLPKNEKGSRENFLSLEMQKMEDLKIQENWCSNEKFCSFKP